MAANTIKFKKIFDSTTIIKKGNRGSLHPDLDLLESIDCYVTYNNNKRIITVDYDYDSKNNKYRKSIFSTTIKNIISDITEFKRNNTI